MPNVVEEGTGVIHRGHKEQKKIKSMYFEANCTKETSIHEFGD